MGVACPTAKAARPAVSVNRRNLFAPRFFASSARPPPLTLREAFAPRLRSSTSAPPPADKKSYRQRTHNGSSSKASSSSGVFTPSTVTAATTGASAPLLGIRRDAPTLKTRKRGTMGDALAAASTSQSRSVALRSLQVDTYAATAHGPRASVWRSWIKLHTRWFGSDLPPLPLTVMKIQAVAASLKAGGYSSFSNYGARAKANTWPPLTATELVGQRNSDTKWRVPFVLSIAGSALVANLIRWTY